MRPVLIVYYSLSGNTRAAAEKLRDELDADMAEIRYTRSRGGVLGILKAVWEALSGATPEIETDPHDLSAHKLVVLATPVWAARPAAPMHAYLVRHASALPALAFLCTLGGSGAEGTFRRMAGASGRSAVATQSLSDADRKADGGRQKIARFAEEIRHAAGLGASSPDSGAEAS
ncbi:MAG: hypothetical protein AAF371_06630 [Pseudomonadota bacterium]